MLIKTTLHNYEWRRQRRGRPSCRVMIDDVRLLDMKMSFDCSNQQTNMTMAANQRVILCVGTGKVQISNIGLFDGDCTSHIEPERVKDNLWLMCVGARKAPSFGPGGGLDRNIGRMGGSAYLCLNILQTRKCKLFASKWGFNWKWFAERNAEIKPCAAIATYDDAFLMIGWR